MRLLFAFQLLFVLSFGLAQKLSKSVPFSLTAYPEPDYFEKMIEVENGVVVLVKTKGTENTTSEYLLEKFDTTLTSVWKEKLTLTKFENFAGLFFNGEHIQLIYNEHDAETRKSILRYETYLPHNGKKIKSDTLFSHTVEPWSDYLGKGTTKQTFNSAVCSKQSMNYVAPLEFRYTISYSPDKKKILIYRFDYSKKTLLSELKVFDNDLNQLSHGTIPVDHGFLVYGYEINNRGDVYIFKANKFGKVAVIQYDLNNQDFRVINIEMSNFQRDNLKLYVAEDDKVYLAKLNKARGVLTAVAYSIFDFTQNHVDHYNFYPVEQAFKNKIIKAEKDAGYDTKEEFKNFNITDFWLDENKRPTLIIEEEEIQSVNFEYDSESVEDIKSWQTELAKVRTGTMLIFQFDENKNLLWSDFIIKNQITDITDGLNTVSYSVDRTSAEKIRVFYSDKGKGLLLNNVKLVEIDKLSGEITKNVEVENPDKLVFLRPFTIWHKDHFLSVGRKGLIGNKTFLVKYSK